jgi:hypothetical protein
MVNQAWDPTLPAKGKKAWDRASEDDQKMAIVNATRFLDGLPFKGQKLSANQPFSWPRRGVFRNDGAPVSGIPPELQEATSMVASFLLAKIPFGPAALGWVGSLIGHLLDEPSGLVDRDISWH